MGIIPVLAFLGFDLKELTNLPVFIKINRVFIIKDRMKQL